MKRKAGTDVGKRALILSDFYINPLFLTEWLADWPLERLTFSVTVEVGGTPLKLPMLSYMMMKNQWV